MGGFLPHYEDIEIKMYEDMMKRIYKYNIKNKYRW